MIILYNSNEGASQQFMANLPEGDYQLIDWYKNGTAREAYVGPIPNVFPSAVIRLSNGSLGLIPDITTVDEAVPANVTESIPLTPGIAFLFAIQNDPMVASNPTLLFNLAQLLALLTVDLQGMQATADPTILQAHWQAALSLYNNTWLNETVQTMILGYASTYSIPLT